MRKNETSIRTMNCKEMRKEYLMTTFAQCYDKGMSNIINMKDNNDQQKLTDLGDKTEIKVKRNRHLVKLTTSNGTKIRF